MTNPAPSAPKLTPLVIPVPPMLEAALGLDTKARYVGLWWEPTGDEAMWSDGFVTTECHWPAYISYTQHPLVADNLSPFELGTSDSDALHMLIIDRTERSASVCPIRDGHRFLADQWPKPERVDPATRQYTDVLDLSELTKPLKEEHAEINLAEIEARIIAQDRLHGELEAWLASEAAK